MSETTCPKCGKPIPSGAHFCPYCESPVIEKKEMAPVKMASGRLKRALFAVLAAVLVLAAVWLAVVLMRPDPVTAEARVKADGTDYRLLLRCSVDQFHLDTPQESAEKIVLMGRYGALPSQLYVFDEATGQIVTDAFEELVSDVKVTAEAVGGGQVCETGAPQKSPGFPQAFREADIIFQGNVKVNRILWTVTMKDGKTVQLAQTLSITGIAQKIYDYHTDKLENMDDVRALVEEIQENGEENTAYTLVLGPYVYEGDLDILTHAVNLTGSEEGGAKTVIRGMVTVTSRFPFAAEMTGITFEGDGSGTGLRDGAGVFAYGCTFRGLETGMQAIIGGYAMPSECLFEDCRTGLLFDSAEADSRKPMFDGNVFRNNGTAVLLLKVPGTDRLGFDGSVFENNGTDIDNRTDHELDLSGAVFDGEPGK